MTFFTTGAPAGTEAGFGLSQRGRAGLEILGAVQKFSSATMREAARTNFVSLPASAGLVADHAEGKVDRDSVRHRVSKARDIAETDPIYRLERFFQRYVAEEIFARGIPAIEERRSQFERFMRATPPDPNFHGSLELDPSLVPPKYFKAIEWHLEPGGWDGYDLYGPLFAFGIGPLVFRHGGYAAVGVGDDILQQRRDVVAQLPKPHYQRIYEPGCGGISTLTALHERFPEAELLGCDLSTLLLKNGFALAQKRQLPVHLKQRDAVNCGEPDASVDAVVTYALHHELPPDHNAKLFDEMFRILKPGGDIVLSDPPPFRSVDLFQAVLLDWDTENREEPFFRAACLADWNAELQRAGFIDISSYSLGQGGYPWVTRAVKPLAH